MKPDAQLRFSVYQEGQRAFRSGTTCPYTDWRAKTWAKGLAAAEAYFSETQREAPEPPTPGPWQPIDTAPRETELLVGRWVNDDWRICQSGFYFDAGNEREGEPAYWYWHCDWDNGGVTDSEGPTHWMPLPAPPQHRQ